MRILKAEWPITRSIGDGLSRTMKVTEYIWQHKGFKYRMLVPALYDFDGASIPRLAWTLLGLTPHGDMDGPSLPHDGGYEFKGKFPEGWLFVEVDGQWHRCYETSKGHLDLLLRALVLFFDIAPKWKANAVYLAVKIFGRWAWHRNDTKRKDQNQ